MFDEKFWLAIAFLAFVALIVKYVTPMIVKTLDAKSKSIAQEILDAKEMKDNAEELLKSVEKYQKESGEYSKHLIEAAKSESEKIISDAKEAAQKEIGKKLEAAFQKIKAEEDKVVRELKTQIVTSASQAALASIKEKLTDEKQAELIQNYAKDL